MKITIYGAGYVGLVTAACFAEMGNHVLCVDIDAARVKKLKKGECPIHEPGLSDMLKHHIRTEHLSFTTNMQQGVEHGLFQFIAVGTPAAKDGSADLSYVLTCTKIIAEHLSTYRLIVNKSTIPVGTTDCVRNTIESVLKKRKMEIAFDVAFNPEFLREGAAISDFMHSDRIIIGTYNQRSEEQLRALYQPFNRDRTRLISMDVRSAELSKYAANAILAAKISFMNEMSQLAELVDADIDAVRLGIGSDPRIGAHFINPGCGYGGSCFPKDVSALEHLAKQIKYDASLIRAIQLVNERQKRVLFRKISHHFKQQLKDKVFALWGLSFKPDTDDMREASSRVLMEQLWEAGARVQAYDPVAMPEAKRLYANCTNLTLCKTPEAALEQADALIVVTEWKMFLSPDFERIKNTLKNPVIFDGRNLYDPAYLKQNGFTYYAIGRGEKG